MPFFFFIPVCHFGYLSIDVGRQRNHKRHTENSKHYLFFFFFFLELKGMKTYKRFVIRNTDLERKDLFKLQTFQNKCTFDCKNNVNLF